MINFIVETPDASSPWWLAAIVLPLAAFCAWLVRWILVKQEEREKVLFERETKREVREERRAEQDSLQTQALQNVVTELRRISEQQEEHARAMDNHARALDAMPARVADQMKLART